MFVSDATSSPPPRKPPRTYEHCTFICNLILFCKLKCQCFCVCDACL